MQCLSGTLHRMTTSVIRSLSMNRVAPRVASTRTGTASEPGQARRAGTAIAANRVVSHEGQAQVPAPPHLRPLSLQKLPDSVVKIHYGVSAGLLSLVWHGAFCYNSGAIECGREGLISYARTIQSLARVQGYIAR